MHDSREVNPSSEEEAPPDEPWWDRQFTPRQTLLALLIVGFAGAFVIVAVGDNYNRQHMPTLSEIGMYVVVAIILAPMIAGVGWLASARTRRRWRGNDGGS